MFRSKISSSPQRHCVYTINGYYCHLSELFITFLLDLPVLHFQIGISPLPNPTHWRAVMEPLIHRVTFASRLHSDFKHPDLHASALCVVPPGANLISYSHASCLPNSAKLFRFAIRGTHHTFVLQDKLHGVGIDFTLILLLVPYKPNHC